MKTTAQSVQGHLAASYFIANLWTKALLFWELTTLLQMNFAGENAVM